jgi:3-isopropylmalate/(R)-2-methylmalate dehydratase small subunit
MAKIKGKTWVASTYVMAYDMVVQKFWTSPVDATENAKWIMAGVSEEFNYENGFVEKGYTFIVAGHNFAGGGKSIEHVIAGLMGANIKAVFAINFSRLQFRNAINYGLPFITASEPLWKNTQTGDELEWDTDTGEVTNLRTGITYTTVPIAPFVTEVAESGGLMNFIKKKIADGTVAELR